MVWVMESLYPSPLLYGKVPSDGANFALALRCERRLWVETSRVACTDGMGGLRTLGGIHTNGLGGSATKARSRRSEKQAGR